MDALDLLVDFSGLLSCSALKPDPIDAKSNHKNITSGPRISTTLHTDLQPTPEQSRGVIATENWTSRPQNPPYAAVSHGSLQAQSPRDYNCNWDRQSMFGDCHSIWSNVRHFQQSSNGQFGNIGETHGCFYCGYAPTWTTPYTFESNAPIVNDTRMPYQHTHVIHDAGEAKSFAFPDYRLSESSCRNEGCNCQAYGPRFTNAVNGYMLNSMDVQRDTGATFCDNQLGRIYDPWTAIATNEEQWRLSQAQQY
jgi:hypothetical protein